MSVAESLKQVSFHDAPPSAGRDIFAQYAKGQISFHEYQVATGVWTASTAHSFTPKRVPGIDPAIARYIDDRIMGRCEYQSTSAQRLSDWFMVAFRVNDQNEADLRTLSWAREKCELVGMTEHIEKVGRKINEYESTPFPVVEFERASRVLKLDADERQRMTRGMS
jgi:hypothetical protein